MEGRMSCVCLARCGLRCLRPEQLFQGQLHVQQRCMASTLQLSWGLLSVLYLIPQWVINKLLLITMGAVKDPFSSMFPTAAFGTALFTAVIKPVAVTKQLGWRQSISWPVLIQPHYKKWCCRKKVISLNYIQLSPGTNRYHSKQCPLQYTAAGLPTAKFKFVAHTEYRHAYIRLIQSKILSWQNWNKCCETLHIPNTKY